MSDVSSSYEMVDAVEGPAEDSEEVGLTARVKAEKELGK